LAALGFLGYAVVAAWRQLSVEDVDVRWGIALLSLTALVAVYFAMVALWGRLLGDLGAPLRYPEALRLWSFANLGRYIPGKLWQVIGLAAAARDIGVAAGLAVAAAVIALALMVSTGALVGVVLAPDVAPRRLAVGTAALLAGGLLIAVARPAWIASGLRRLPRALGCSEVASPTRATVARWIALFSAAWVAHGAAFALFASSLGDVAWRDAPRLAGAFALAYVGGLLAVFAPGGIGVREGILGQLLGSAGADVPAHVVAIASRLWAMAGEIVVLAVAAVVQRRSAGTRA
jgi:hypothetical protein